MRSMNAVCGVYLSLLVSFYWPPLLSASDNPIVELTVRQGDTLIELCDRYLESPNLWKEVAKRNHLANPHRIYPDQRLQIPQEFFKGLPLDGTITFLKGNVGLFIRAKKEWQSPGLNAPIREGTRIRTGDNSTAEITFEDGVSLLIRSNASIEIASAERKGALHSVYRLFLDIGRSVSKIRQNTGAESRLSIETPSAVAAARGTDFRVSVDSEASTRCEVLAGRVDISGGAGEVTLQPGEGTIVKKGRSPEGLHTLLPPPRPLDLLPLYKAMPMTISFDRIEAARSYRVMVARDEGFKDLILEKVLEPDRPLQILAMADGPYFLQSRAIDALGLEGPPCKSLPFRIRVNPLPPFVQQPVAGVRHRERQIAFQWLRVQGAKVYHLQIAEDPEFRTIVEESGATDEVHYRAENLGFTTYYFRVRSIADDGYAGEWSDALTFEIIPPPPSPAVEEPTLGDKKIQIRWRGLGSGITYRFQMARDSSFSETILDYRVDEPAAEFDRPGKCGMYYVRTSAIDAEGYEGPFSLPQTFEIKKAFSLVPLGTVLGIAAVLVLF